MTLTPTLMATATDPGNSEGFAVGVPGSDTFLVVTYAGFPDFQVRAAKVVDKALVTGPPLNSTRTVSEASVQFRYVYPDVFVVPTNVGGSPGVPGTTSLHTYRVDSTTLVITELASQSVAVTTGSSSFGAVLRLGFTHHGDFVGSYGTGGTQTLYRFRVETDGSISTPLNVPEGIPSYADLGGTTAYINDDVWLNNYGVIDPTAPYEWTFSGAAFVPPPPPGVTEIHPNQKGWFRTDFDRYRDNNHFLATVMDRDTDLAYVVEYAWDGVGHTSSSFSVVRHTVGTTVVADNSVNSTWEGACYLPDGKVCAFTSVYPSGGGTDVRIVYDVFGTAEELYVPDFSPQVPISPLNLTNGDFVVAGYGSHLYVSAGGVVAGVDLLMQGPMLTQTGLRPIYTTGLRLAAAPSSAPTPQVASVAADWVSRYTGDGARLIDAAGVSQGVLDRDEVGDPVEDGYGNERSLVGFTLDLPADADITVAFLRVPWTSWWYANGVGNLVVGWHTHDTAPAEWSPGGGAAQLSSHDVQQLVLEVPLQWVSSAVAGGTFRGLTVGPGLNDGPLYAGSTTADPDQWTLEIHYMAGVR